MAQLPDLSLPIFIALGQARSTNGRSTAAGGLEKFARLDTTATVIDAFTIFNDFDTDDILSSRRNDVLPEDERTVSDLMVDQIEFADVIVLNKTEMVGIYLTYQQHPML